MNREDLVTKKPILAVPPPEHRDDPRRSGEIEVKKIDGGHMAPSAREGFDGQGAYVHPSASRPGKPNIVEAEIKAAVRVARKTLVAYLRGGPFDGTEVDVDSMALKYAAVIERDPATIEPFVFVEGQPNIIQGDHDTITYKRTSEKTPGGAVIFQAVA